MTNRSNDGILLKQLGQMMLVLIALCGIARSQGSTGSITGTVLHPRKSLIARASIVVRNDASQTGFRVATDKKGIYNLPDLQLGEYTVTIGANGRFSNSYTFVVAAL